MAYDSDYLQLVKSYTGPVGRNEWLYDTLDAVGTVDGADYFSDAALKGMEVGDLIYCRVWTTAIPATQAAKRTGVVADAAWFLVTSFAGNAATVATETAIVVAEGA